ncbi:MAG: DUF4421 family protein [Bacteroidaceae bacterium]|nr:DUF4421 family protein [Bacteroidaceae bacterium]
MTHRLHNINRHVAALVLATCPLCYASAQTDAESIANSEDGTETVVKKKSFKDKLPKPIRWFLNNWSAYDPRYSTPSFYMWVGQFQNTFSNEWFSMRTSDGMDVTMSSKLSSKIGPQLGYSFLMYGYTIDLNALKGTKRKNEFTLAINSNLLNVDIIRRRTGGDFRTIMAKSENFDFASGTMKSYDMTDRMKHYESMIDDLIEYDVTGININYFTNHKKYSNPAAFSNGAIQLRSVGSPILGFGYTRQKISTDINDAVVNSSINTVASMITPDQRRQLLDEAEKTNGRKFANIDDYTSYLTKLYDEDKNDLYCLNFSKIYNNSLLQPLLFGKQIYDEHGMSMGLEDSGELHSIFNSFPSVTTIDDWHLQLGYAYNLVFSRRLLLGVSLVASPGIKRIHYDNQWSLAYLTKNELWAAINSYYTFGSIGSPEDFVIDKKQTSFGTNLSARFSITYNYNRWRAGVNAIANAFLYKTNDITINNAYGSANVYVGYCFGRKKQYRWNGKDREAYITAALTKRQIEEMKDTMPQSNISKGSTYLSEFKKTKYHTDHFNFDIIGCDLVKGPDGKYGTFEIQDGLVTQGQDTEERLKPGTILEMDKDGDFEVEVGHRLGFSAANWWKSQLKVSQTPTHWYPEMLHYGLRGKLTMYVRNHTFGTKQPVKVEIENFCINHGKETKQFFQIGAQDFYSHSSYSIIGTANVNNRLCRIYIESKKRGTRNYIYINRMKASGSTWMERIPDDRAIGRISMPGTHDAGTASLPESSLTHMSHTQNFTISEQLLDGIRAFDIRLKKNMKYGHTMTCREGFDETLVDIRQFLKDNPSEFLVAMIGSDEGGKWSDEMRHNFNQLTSQYKDLFIDDFDATTPISKVRGKVLVIRRQEGCPYGKLLKFTDNAVFENGGFCVEDVYKEHKTYKKIKLVEQHLRDAFENDNPNLWYITFNSIAWDPRHHKPYYSAWGAVNVRKPMNKALREVIETKGYNNFGMVFLDFYNDHGDKPQLVESIINSNFHFDVENDYIPYDKQ